jgi:hypothetical protein
MMRASRDHVSLVLLGDGSGRPFIGVHEVPGRLPEMLRYPGESAQAFSTRALHAVQGRGALWARLMYRDDSTPLPLLGPSTEVKDTRRIERENAVVRGISKW